MGIFGDKTIRFIGVTGGIGSGKSLFGLSLDPDCREVGKESKTLVIDDEFSTDAYTQVRSFDRKDISDFVDENEPMEMIWQKFVIFTKGIAPGRYRILFIDTLNTLEKALEAWTRKNPQFGHTVGQYAKMSAIMQDDMKQVLMQFLTRVAAPRFESVCWTAHEKVVWEDNSPTNKKRPQGRDVWMKCAHLYLRLSRDRKPGQKNPPEIPAGTVLKGRVLHRLPDGSESSWLPETIPECTPDKIREYAVTPANRKALKKSEQLTETVNNGAIEEAMTDDERLRINAKMEEDKRKSAESALELMEQKRELNRLAAKNLAKKEKLKESASGSSWTVGSGVMKVVATAELNIPAEEEKAPATEEAQEAPSEPLPETQPEKVQATAPNMPVTSAGEGTKAGRIVELWQKLGRDMTQLPILLEKNYGSPNPIALTPEKQDAAIRILESLVAKQEGN